MAKNGMPDEAGSSQNSNLSRRYAVGRYSTTPDEASSSQISGSRMGRSNKSKISETATLPEDIGSFHGIKTGKSYHTIPSVVMSAHGMTNCARRWAAFSVEEIDSLTETIKNVVVTKIFPKLKFYTLNSQIDMYSTNTNSLCYKVMFTFLFNLTKLYLINCHINAGYEVLQSFSAVGCTGL